MTRIQNDNDEILTKQKDVFYELTMYYTNLYNQRPESEHIKEDMEDFIRGENFQNLEPDEALVCEGSITIEEASNTLRSMKNGSSPGSDGLTIEFITFFLG
eukprot:TRINITY_DN62607_c0_g1_i5.p1 TRINITY_DN62607_c0_g1~~TRINITY_DN62607_c0_g1_i5.p1  ORF type:complete len:101 (-),score=11.68 TRINITY_DN62607_c0_g1_i5:35-337(-)